MIQIAHIIRQLLEKGVKEIKELRLKLKEISQILKKNLSLQKLFTNLITQQCNWDLIELYNNLIKK